MKQTKVIFSKKRLGKFEEFLISLRDRKKSICSIVRIFRCSADWL